MARSKLIETTEDLINDSGSVLWSFIKGEQLEFPITLNFIENASLGYTFEAVVIEALNIAGDTSRPTSIKPNGVQTVVSVRVPTYRGNWDPPQAYNREEIVKYNNKYYKLQSGVARISSVTPELDPTWLETPLNKVYIQFQSNLGSTWEIQPTVDQATYGFFELRVTEPTDSIFRRTWKPVRGMIEILFSPTELVPDV